MKKTTFILLLALSCCWLAAQCPTGDITFSTQGPSGIYVLHAVSDGRVKTGKILKQ